MSREDFELGQSLPAGLPHVAYILLWYPLFTQPFIFSEVESLRARLPLSVFTLYGKNLRYGSAAMLARKEAAYAFGLAALPRLLLEGLRQMFTHPLRFFRLFARTFFRPWKSFEVLGENLWAFGVGLYLGRLFIEAGIDLIYAPWPRGAATAAWVASSLSGLPFGFCARGDNLDPADPDLEAKLAAAGFVRANNAADKARLECFGHGQAGGKVELIYNNLTLPFPEPSPDCGAGGNVPAARRAGNDGRVSAASGGKQAPPAPLRLLALGRFDVTKGFDVLLRACGILRDRGLPFTLTLAGGGGTFLGLGHEEGDLRALRRELRLEREVSMPGLISHDALPELLRAHQIFVAPCVVHPSGRRDGIPNTVIEAMSYGLPVVATTVNALPEVVRDHETGLAVPPGDALALADAVESLYRDPALARRLGANAAGLARRMFDPRRNSLRLMEFFCKAAKGGGAGGDGKCAA